jgi:hypothetical protein
VKGMVAELFSGGSSELEKEKPQISPLRFAPVEMTIHFYNAP